MLYCRPMRWFSSLLLPLALACALVFAPARAWAQTTTAGAPSVQGLEGSILRCENPVGSTCNTGQNADSNPPVGHPHPNGVTENVINFEDCEANLYYQFPLAISTPNSSYNLEVWAGTEDCSVLANRQTSALSLCWPVYLPQASNVQTALVNVRVRDLISGAFTTTHPVNYVATAPDTSDDSICQTQPTTGPTALQMYAFFTDAEGNPYNSDYTWAFNVNMRAGDVQGAITAGVGDTVLIITIPPTTDTNTQGYNVYCDPPPGPVTSAVSTVPVNAASNNGQCAPPVADSSTVSDALDDAVSINDASDDTGGVAMFDDAGGNACGVPLNDAGIPSPGGCTTSTVLVSGGASTNLIPETNEAGETIYVEGGASDELLEGGVAFSGGKINPLFQYNQLYYTKYLCGYGSVSSSTINVTNLVNYIYYNISVAVVDGSGNVGPLSNVVCGEPVPVADFWYTYYEAGGRAGGFCSTQGVGVPAGTGGLGVLMAASIVAMIRRRRRG